MQDHSNIPYGFCHCGCGQKTKLARRNSVKRGMIKGMPIRFVLGHSTHLPARERFWSKVNRDGPIPMHKPELGHCWTWTGSADRHGYGHLGIYTSKVKAHRFSWELHNGPIPIGLCVLHHCDYPPCTRPDHLFLGTMKDNTQDMLAKGRYGDLKGERSGRAILTAEQVLMIREMAQEGAKPMVLARQFRVAKSTIRDIIKRRNWQHI